MNAGFLMAITARQPRHTLSRWAWAMIALTPIGWAAGILLVFLSGEGQAAGFGPTLVGLLGVAVFVGVPAVSLALAVQARRTGPSSSRAVTIVSGILYAITVFGTMLVGTAALVGALSTVILLLFLGLRSRKRRD